MKPSTTFGSTSSSTWSPPRNVGAPAPGRTWGNYARTKPPNGRMSGLVLLAWLGYLMPIVVLVLGIWTLILVLRLRTALDLVERDARDTERTFPGSSSPSD
jgi:hypothetical protein